MGNDHRGDLPQPPQPVTVGSVRSLGPAPYSQVVLGGSPTDGDLRRALENSKSSNFGSLPKPPFQPLVGKRCRFEGPTRNYAPAWSETGRVLSVQKFGSSWW